MKNVQTVARLITYKEYPKKDKETKEPTGELGYFISLLIDEDKDVKLSGNVIKPFVAEDARIYINLDEITKPLPAVVAIVDVPTTPKSSYILHELALIEDK